MTSRSRADGFSIVAKGSGVDREAEIILYEEIDANLGIGAKRFRDALAAVGDVSTLHVHINSPGGQVFEGLGIYNTLKSHKARVIVHIDGMALSMASVVAMAGDEIEAAGSAFLMIHNPMNVAMGDGDDLRHSAELLDKLRNQLATIYANRSKQSVERVLELMEAESWFDANEALRLGLVDRVTADLAVAASFDPGRFQRVPERFQRRATLQPPGAIAMADDPKAKVTDPPTDKTKVPPPPLPASGAPADTAARTTATAVGTIHPHNAADYTYEQAKLDLTKFRAAQAAETERVARIRAVCDGRHPAIEAQAIRDGWTGDRAELEVLRASRPTGPAIHAGGPAPNVRMLEAGLLLAVAHPEKALLKAFGQETVEKAERFRRIGFKELVDVCCAMEGRKTPGFGASDVDRIRAGFSTVSLPGILSNVGHKVMLAAYQDVPGLADLLCRRLTASDFKTHTGYRLSGDFKLEEVGADGELKHATVAEASYTYAVKTYGKIFGLTRQMQINDDLGAFAEVPRMIGRGAALTKERLFWTLVHANTGNFFHADNGNLITKVLGSEGMKLAVKALEEQTDDQDDPILVMGRYLVVPPALKEAAKELYVSTYVNTGGAATKEKVPNRNVYEGEYEPRSSPYISNTTFHASASATQWYLWGNPSDVAAFGIAYLNGQDTPTVEEAPLSGEYLGNAWRGFIDYGVCQVDYRGAVKSTGTVA